MVQTKALAEKAADAFRTISEVGDDLDVPKHVLRFWEGKFPQIKPMKRGGGRRYYRPEDVELLRGIRRLLYDEGYTIKGVQKLIRDNGLEFVKTFSEAAGSTRRRKGQRNSVEAVVVVPARPRRLSARHNTSLSEQPAMVELTVDQSEFLRLALVELRACRVLLEK